MMDLTAHAPASQGKMAICMLGDELVSLMMMEIEVEDKQIITN